MSGPGNAPFCTKRGASAAADFNATTSSYVPESENTQHASKQKSDKQKQKQKQKQKCKDDDTTKAPNRAAPYTDVGFTLEAKQLDESIESDKSMTVLLFEDVDMVFEDDRGFMAAVAQVAATAKRPIILTSNGGFPSCICMFSSLFTEFVI